ncbi:hypothetical protein CNMCM6457_005783 [Aspergillus fumigatiaffinis]|nr:hypothetical protein CNMCM6457_005783 [Aspergillus fumigatiaffinis]
MVEGEEPGEEVIRDLGGRTSIAEETRGSEDLAIRLSGATRSAEEARKEEVISGGHRCGVPGPPICIQRYLGTDLEHTVPVAEVAGLVLALRLLKRDLVPRDVQRAPPPSRGSRKRAEIYSDNQGTLRTLLDPKQGSGQYLVRELVDLLDWLDPVLDISFHWLAAHEGVAGNELADQKAKEAAGWRQGLTDGQCGPLPPVTLPDHPTRGPLDAWIKQYTKEQWEEAWRQSEHGRHLQRFLPEVTRHSIAIYDDLTPVECSVLAQMRTGKIGLNHYLSTINRADDPLCPCGRAPETTHHVLFSCTRYDDLRRAAWPEGGPRDLTEALTEKQYVRRAARFMLNTGRLTYLAEATEPAWLEPSAPSITPTGTASPPAAPTCAPAQYRPAETGVPQTPERHRFGGGAPETLAGLGICDI